MVIRLDKVYLGVVIFGREVPVLISQQESYPEHFEQLHYQSSVRVIKDR